MPLAFRERSEDKMMSNREMFASMTLEPIGRHSTDAQPQPDAAQEDNTKKIIACMKRALRTSLSNISLQQKERPLNPGTDFVFKAKVEFDTDADQRVCSCVSVAPTQVRDADGGDFGPFIFTDYAPMCYRQIRGFFGIEWKAFQDVLCSSTWHSVPTPGKSTAQLFFCGQNWVIKTMTREESKFLREILHRYYYHVRDNAHTLLPHFVGHHSLELTIGGSVKKISFVIMQNVFATPNKMHEKFDLKGSTVGRFAAPHERKKQTCTKKDLDIDRPIRVGVARKELVMNQLRRDCDFLKKACIMDYSFLVGIHYVQEDSGATASPPRTRQVDDERSFTSDQGGMMSAHSSGRNEIYYVGIIDILQEYNLWKRSETAVRSVLEDINDISSVDPREYSSRFLAFVETILV